MTTVIATANLNFGRSKDAQLADVLELMAHADIVCTQEDVTGTNREHMRFAKHVQHGGRHSMLAFLDRHGFRILFRRIVWADVEDTAVDFTLVLTHIPPRRMALLQRIAAARLRALLRRLDKPWIVAADWNHFLRNDPCDLHKTFGAYWYGDGIDGFAVHPDLVKHVKGVTHVDQPHRNDGHPFVYLTIA